jgi:glycine cleavage system aminomethyltransferase T
MREGVELFATGGTPVGRVTSGGFGPSVNAPIAMGYVARHLAAPGPAGASARQAPARHRLIFPSTPQPTNAEEADEIHQGS